MFMPRREGPPMIMDEIPRTYYPGRGFLTDQEAYPTDIYGNPRMPGIPRDIFNRAPRYSGGLGIPGAPGNNGIFKLPYNPANDLDGFMHLPYYPGSDMGGVELLAGSFPMPIDPNAHRQKQKTQKIYNKGVNTNNPYEKEEFLKRTGIRLPKV